MIRSFSRGLVAVLSLTVGSRVADAQAPPPEPPAPLPGEAAAQDPPQAPEAEPVISPEEQAELDAATGADAADAARATPPPPASASAGAGAPLQSMNPDLAFVLDVAAAAFSDAKPLQTGGHDPARNGFSLQQLELSISKNVDPYFRFDSNIVFSQFGVEVEEAYATTLALPHQLQLRAGQFLTRFGRLNATHPHAWDFVDQPLAIGRVFGGEGNRGLGAELSWLSPLPWYVELLGSVTEAGGEGTARSFFGGEDPGVEKPTDFQVTFAAKQFFELSDDWSLMWGLSYAGGPNSSGHDNRSEVYGTDLYLKYRPITTGSHTIVTLQAEWLYRRRQVPGDVLSDQNGYAYLSWRFAQRWATAARWEYGSAAHDRSGDVAADPLDPEWTSGRQRLSANLTLWPTEFSRLRLQGSVDAPGWHESPTWALMLAAEFIIGAHGAHKF